MYQNYFGNRIAAPARDQYSIINIMIAKQLPSLKPAAAVQSPVKIASKQDKQGKKIVVKPVSSDIEEDIISEQIEGGDDKNLSNRSHQNADSSIDEDIIVSGDHQAGTSSSAASAPESKPF